VAFCSLDVCVCVCVSIYIYIYIHTHTHTHIYVSLFLLSKGTVSFDCRAPFPTLVVVQYLIS
jgi:hypothetical protein